MTDNAAGGDVEQGDVGSDLSQSSVVSVSSDRSDDTVIDLASEFTRLQQMHKRLKLPDYTPCFTIVYFILSLLVFDAVFILFI